MSVTLNRYGPRLLQFRHGERNRRPAAARVRAAARARKRSARRPLDGPHPGPRAQLSQRARRPGTPGALSARPSKRFALALAGTSLAAWLGLAVARGRFWQVDLGPSEDEEPARGFASVEAVIPARNEAATIGRTVTSLLRQRYGGPFAVTVVDDASSDATDAVACRGRRRRNGRRRPVRGRCVTPGRGALDG